MREVCSYDRPIINLVSINWSKNIFTIQQKRKKDEHLIRLQIE